MTSISSHTQPGTEIINVVATDRDSGIYGLVTYELVPGEFSSFFTVDTSTGTAIQKGYNYATCIFSLMMLFFLTWGHVRQVKLGFFWKIILDEGGGFRFNMKTLHSLE